MTTGWSIFIIALVLINVIGSLWLLISLTKGKITGEGEQTTHVWDEDLTEYNNPLPRWWLYLFWITVIFSAAYVVIYPGFGNFAGVTGWTQEGQYENEVAAAEKRFGNVFAEFAATPLAELVDDPEAVRLGRNLFANHCATCHGSDARGAVGFPNLTDNDWLYGDSAETIRTSITNGRTGVMPALGPALGDEGTDAVVAYVMSLAQPGSVDSQLTAQGQQKFLQFCSACHGPTGTGVQVLGGPNLADNVWLHRSSAEDVREIIMSGRVNEMPAQGALLSDDRIRTLVAYVQSLGAGE